MILLLAFLNPALMLAFHVWYVHTQRQDTQLERQRHDEQIKILIKANLSRSLEEFTSSQVIEKQADKPQVPPDMISTDTLTDEQFNKIIGNQVDGN